MLLLLVGLASYAGRWNQWFCTHTLPISTNASSANPFRSHESRRMAMPKSFTSSPRDSFLRAAGVSSSPQLSNTYG